MQKKSKKEQKIQKKIKICLTSEIEEKKDKQETQHSRIYQHFVLITLCFCDAIPKWNKEPWKLGEYGI